jgi:hypothetical protein
MGKITRPPALKTRQVSLPMCPLAPVTRIDAIWLAQGMWLFCMALKRLTTTGYGLSLNKIE